MNVPARHLAWIGGAASPAPGATFSPLVSPIDETSASQIIESDAENQAFLIDGTRESVLRPQGWQHFE